MFFCSLILWDSFLNWDFLFVMAYATLWISILALCFHSRIRTAHSLMQKSDFVSSVFFSKVQYSIGSPRSPIWEKMLCACSGEQFKFEEPPQSPESLATRDFSASGLSSRTGDWDSKFDDIQVDEAESTLKEALSLNYEVGLSWFVNQI